MGSQGAAVDLGAGAGPADALGDVEDDAREAIFVDVDFLIIGDLSEGAVFFFLLKKGVKRGARGTTTRSGGEWKGRERGVIRTYLTSAKFDGRSQTSAPPNNGVVL